MLLDTTAVLLAVGLGAAGFIVVVVVSAVVLRLIGFVVGDYDPDPAGTTGDSGDEPQGAPGKPPDPGPRSPGASGTP